jgi:RNA 2',3'-cyclic 3'-phosphodiesterase
MRLFVGLPLAAEVIDELSAMTARLKRSDDGLRWSAPESWHVTLQFLGNTTQATYACVTARLRTVKWSPVPVHIGEPGFFDRAGVFFADVMVTPELVGLQRQVVTANETCGFGAEARSYHPHITLARIQRGIGDGRRLRSLKDRVKEERRLTRFVATEFLLYESLLLAGGARYEVRERFRFN